MNMKFKKVLIYLVAVASVFFVGMGNAKAANLYGLELDPANGDTVKKVFASIENDEVSIFENYDSSVTMANINAEGIGIPSRSGYAFYGYYLSGEKDAFVNGDGMFDLDAISSYLSANPSSTNLKLKASWHKLDYQINLIANKKVFRKIYFAEIGDALLYDSDAAPISSVNIPESGSVYYEFAGFYIGTLKVIDENGQFLTRTTEDGQVALIKQAVSVNNKIVNVKAKWKKKATTASAVAPSTSQGEEPSSTDPDDPEGGSGTGSSSGSGYSGGSYSGSGSYSDDSDDTGYVSANGDVVTYVDPTEIDPGTLPEEADDDILPIDHKTSDSKSYEETTVMPSQTTEGDVEPNPTAEKAAEKNLYLKSLNVVGYALGPNFNKEIFEYDLSVAEGVTSIQIEATAENPSENTVEGTGTVSIVDEDGTLLDSIEVTVTNSDGDTVEYVINISNYDKEDPEEDPEATDDETPYLKSLSVAGYPLTPAFAKDTNEYSITGVPEDLPSLTITAVPDKETYSVTNGSATGTAVPIADQSEVVITVQNGEEENEYIIEINRKDEEDPGDMYLASLSVKDHDFVDESGNVVKFDKKNDTYSIQVTESEKTVSISAVAEDPKNVSVSGIGTVSLYDGDTLKDSLTITLQNDNSEDTTYDIGLEVKDEDEKETEEKTDSNGGKYVSCTLENNNVTVGQSKTFKYDAQTYVDEGYTISVEPKASQKIVSYSKSTRQFTGKKIGTTSIIVYGTKDGKKEKLRACQVMVTHTPPTSSERALINSDVANDKVVVTGGKIDTNELLSTQAANKPKSISCGANSLKVGTSAKLEYKVNPTAASQKVSIKTDDKKIASVVTKEGTAPKIKGEKVGSVKITITSSSDKTVTKQCTVKVVKDAQALKETVAKWSISPSSSESKPLTINVGKTVNLNTEIDPSTAKKSLTWKSGSKKIATVNSYGYVTGVKSGTVEITAKLTPKNGSAKTKKAYIKVVGSNSTAETVGTTAKTKLEKVEITKDGNVVSGKTITIKAGNSVNFNVKSTPASAYKSQKWSSGSSKLTVNSDNGKVTVKDNAKKGSATVKVVVTDQAGKTKKDTVKIQIEAKANSSSGSGKSGSTGTKKTKVKVTKVNITGAPDSMSVKNSKTKTLGVSVSPSDAANKKVKWSSSNKDYASVGSGGKVTVKKKGIGNTVKITATAKDGSGKSDTVSIKIKK